MKYGLFLGLMVLVLLSTTVFAGNFGEIDANNRYQGSDYNYYKYPFDLNAVSDGTPDVNADSLCWYTSTSLPEVGAATWHSDTNTCSALSVSLPYQDNESYYMVVSNGQGDVNYSSEIIELYLDMNSATVSTTIINDGYITYINSTATDRASNTGIGSDVNVIHYTVDDGTWFSSLGNIWNLQDTSLVSDIGQHTITYYVLDYLDNNTGMLTIDYNIDGEAPAFTGPITATREYIVAGDRNYYDFNVMWISGIVTDRDEDLNILSWAYSVNDGFTWSQLIPDSNFAYPDSNRISVDLNYEWGNTGYVQMKFRISDLNGNTTESADMNWYLDNTAPTTVATWDSMNTMTLVATDSGTPAADGVGVAGYYYSIDGSAWTYVAAASGTVTITTPGDHHIYFYAMDNFDNNEMRDNLSGVPWDKPFTVPGISSTGPVCNLTNLMIMVLVAALLISIVYAGFNFVNDGINLQVLSAVAISAISIMIIIFITASVNGITCAVI